MNATNATIFAIIPKIKDIAVTAPFEAASRTDESVLRIFKKLISFFQFCALNNLRFSHLNVA